MGNKETVRQTRDQKIGIMTRSWVRNRFGVDETPVVDIKPASKTPKVVLFDARTIEAGWIYSRFEVDERS